MRYEYACCVCCGLRVFMIQYSVLVTKVIMELVLVPSFTSYTFTPLQTDSNSLPFSVLLPSFLFLFFHSFFALMHLSISSSFSSFVIQLTYCISLSLIVIHYLVILPSIPTYYHMSLVFPYPILLSPPPKDTL